MEAVFFPFSAPSPLQRRLKSLGPGSSLRIAASHVRDPFVARELARLARRGVDVDMPLRRSSVHALDVIAYSGDSAAVSGVRLELHVSSGTYVRSIAQALGGHCTTLRRVAVGPFSVDEAAPVEDATLLPVGDVLARLPAEALDNVSEGVRAGVLALDAPVGNGSAA